MGLLFASALWTIAWWTLSWSSVPILSEYSFFPLWLGYILIFNAVSEILFRDSLIRRMGGWFVLLFLVSTALWWFFEWLNSFLQNWHYVFLHSISPLHYVIQASIDFSTVVPAVLSSTFLLFRLLEARRIGKSPPVAIGRRWLIVAAAIGLASFYLMQAFPRETFPLAWIAPFLVLEPFLYISGLPSLLGQIAKGDWTLMIAAMTATLFTGLFWELWNYYSLPKWYYTIPYVDFWRVFEMPILGYAGYPFFGIVVVSYSIAVLSVVRWNLIALLTHRFGERFEHDEFRLIR